MNPTEVTYPVFEANQVLTNAHLNDLFEYLDEQTRLTRSNLIGIGIVCGLEVTFEAPGTVHLSKGCGVTSQGYLIVEPDRSRSRLRALVQAADPSTAIRRSSSPAPTPAEQFDLWELFADDDEPGAQPLATSGLVLEDKAVLLFLELRKDGLRNCSPNNCDDRGAEVTATVRRLLIDVSRPRRGDRRDQRSRRRSTSVPTSPSGSPCPTCACRASTCPTADLSAPEEVLFAFQATFRQNKPGRRHRGRAHQALRRVQAAGRRRVPDQPVRHLQESVRLPRRDPGDDGPGPLHAVLLGPVRRPARGLRRAALEGRRPDVRLLPARGPVPAPPDGGCARPGHLRHRRLPPRVRAVAGRRRLRGPHPRGPSAVPPAGGDAGELHRGAAGQGRPGHPEPLGRRGGVGQGDPVLLRPGRHPAGVRAVGPAQDRPPAGPTRTSATGPTSTPRPRRRS